MAFRVPIGGQAVVIDPGAVVQLQAGTTVGVTSLPSVTIAGVPHTVVDSLPAVTVDAEPVLPAVAVSTWTADQLAALRELVDYDAALTITDRIASRLSDTSPQAAAVTTDLQNATSAVWARVKG